MLDPTIINTINPIAGEVLTLLLVNLQSPAEIKREILTRIPTSPIRFVRAVIMPAL